VAVGDSVDPDRWRVEFDELMGRVASRFGRVEPRATARAFVRGLLAPIERKNCWSLAEHAGLAGPQAMQRLLRTACWDADGVRDDVRAYVAGYLGHRDGVLIVDEIGFLKKGTQSAGVQRQYTGTAGRIENSQVGVFLAYATPRGRALIDRRLYVPEKTWCADADRRAQAGIPADITFATKPCLGTEMIIDALDAGIPARWVTGDEVYGAGARMRGALEARGVGYVLAVACDHQVVRAGTKARADAIAASLPTSAWHRYSAGPGAKGPRYYDWAWTGIDDGERHALMIRRNITTGELAFYRCWSPDPVPLPVLVKVAGTRWAIEELFQTAKGQVGLDHYQVRTWTAWHRFITLAMLALAYLAVLATLAATTNHGITALTMPEIRRLLGELDTLTTRSARTVTNILHWSRWRRRHQHHARQCHYRRRLAALTNP
jgi:SRSO17 transposase